MRLILALLPVPLLLVACYQAEPLAGNVPDPDSLPDPVPAALTGEYRVAAIDGEEVGGGIGIALSVTDGMMWFDPRCAGFSWTYTYADGVLTTDRPEKPRSGEGPFVARPMRPTCRIAVHPEQQRLATALDAVTNAWKTPSNGVELNGGGHSVTLFSQ
ncbi:hypothetical protein [Erythrobacter aurantius]|uniref:hypothetical protein n=1 Tax=Erythrobacter aurantius TaxID=2909249 RepID=UPI00207AF923|nr:hypothetical protein [Erythrobacter aurantius]